jgi:hypothetical protein
MVLGGDTGRVPSDVTLDNWQSAAQLHWTFQHVADFLSTATISRGTGPVAKLPSTPVDLSDIPLYDRTNRRRTTVGEVMAATATDGWIVIQHGKVLGEYYYGGMEADSSHLLMSVSKSLIAMVAGALSPTAPTSTRAQPYACTGEFGYAGARVRHVPNAFGDSVFRGLSGPDGRGAVARTGHRMGAAHGAGPADHDVRLSAHTAAEIAARGAVRVPVL